MKVCKESDGEQQQQKEHSVLRNTPYKIENETYWIWKCLFSAITPEQNIHQIWKKEEDMNGEKKA